jgi:hypothetical protein
MIGWAALLRLELRKTAKLLGFTGGIDAVVIQHAFLCEVPFLVMSGSDFRIDLVLPVFADKIRPKLYW